VRKPDIPLMIDPVNKLQAVGKETVSKLKDLQAAAAVSVKANDSEVLAEFTCYTNNVLTGCPFDLCARLHAVSVVKICVVVVSKTVRLPLQ